jgi:hypothetical protein
VNIVVSLTRGGSGRAGEDEYYDDYDASNVLRYEDDGVASFDSHELQQCHDEEQSAKSGRDGNINHHVVTSDGFRLQPLYAMTVAMEGVDQGEQDDGLEQGAKVEQHRRKCISMATMVTTKALDSVMRNLRTQGDRGRGHIEKPHDEQREEKGRI